MYVTTENFHCPISVQTSEDPLNRNARYYMNWRAWQILTLYYKLDFLLLIQVHLTKCAALLFGQSWLLQGTVRMYCSDQLLGGW